MSGAKIKFVYKKPDVPNIVAWPCVIAVPQDGGTFQEQELTVRYRVLDADAYQAAAAKGERALLDEIVAGFLDFNDENGMAVKDDAARELLFKLPYAVTGLIGGWMKMMAGRIPKN
jgi:hypothetical protein